MSFTDFKQFGDHRAGYKTLYEKALPILKDAPVQYQAVEIGTREGGSALTLLNAILDTNPKRFFHTVDPYGQKPYYTRDQVIPKMYSDLNYRRMRRNVTPYVDENNLNWVHWKLTSFDWMRVYPTVNFWDDSGTLKDEFCFVYLDGDHTTEVVLGELAWFVPRTHGLIVIDDADQIDVSKIGGEVEDNYLCIQCE